MDWGASWEPLCVGAFPWADRELEHLVLPCFQIGAEALIASLKGKRALQKAKFDSFASIIGEFRGLFFPRNVSQANNLTLSAAGNFLAAVVKEFSL